MNTPSLTVPGYDLTSIWRHILARNNELGLQRYDPVDILSHRLYRRVLTGPVSRYLSYAWRLPAVVFPFAWRRFLGIEKQLNPSTLYHLGSAYLLMEAVDPGWVPAEAEAMCDLAYQVRLPAEYICWTYPYWQHDTEKWLAPARLNSFPPSCGHYVSRLGRFLARVGKAHNQETYLAQGISACNALLSYHHWKEYPDGSCSISYYPMTDDETINICADTAALLAEIPAARRTPQMQARLVGLTTLIVQEQGTQGEWQYSTTAHYRQWRDTPCVDNHHTAMILTALAIIYNQGALPLEQQQKIQQAILKGLDFYLSNLYLEDGTGIHVWGWKDEADIVGYSEAAGAISEILERRIPLPQPILAKARAMLPRILNQAIGKFYNPKTGDVASKRKGRYTYNVQSIRWGSGPLLQAIAAYLRASRPGE